jgi:hypothetical protein
VCRSDCYLQAELARAAAEFDVGGDLGRSGAAFSALEGADQGQLPEPTHQLRRPRTFHSNSHSQNQSLHGRLIVAVTLTLYLFLSL